MSRLIASASIASYFGNLPAIVRASADELVKVPDVGPVVAKRIRDFLDEEHNLEVIKTADYIVDLGPEGGDKGGHIVALGTPEEVAGNKKSHTGNFLREILRENTANATNRKKKS